MLATIADTRADEGLEKKGTELSQIPTYVTAVPNGTEKVHTSTSYTMRKSHN